MLNSKIIAMRRFAEVLASKIRLVDSSRATGAIVSLCFLVACGAIALHSPGHVSMDTSVQLYEASIGESVSWNPPFMSAVLRWFGGGELATASIVLLNTLCFYGAFAMVAISVSHMRKTQGLSKIPTWRAAVACLLILNPVIFVYTGIVWKDVLFAALLTAAAALGILTASKRGLELRVYAALSILLFASALLTRQQGIFMAPLLLLILPIARWPVGRFSKIRLVALILIGFVAAVLMLQATSSQSIRRADGQSTSVGYRSIMIFDLAGIVAYSTRTSDEFAYPITAQQTQAVRAVYDPRAIDYLERNPVAINWIGALSNRSLFDAWRLMVIQNPSAYLSHRIAVYGTLLGLPGKNLTAPLHIGVDGNAEYLAAVGVPVGRDARDQLVYQIASSFFKWPIYRHAFWLCFLVAATVIVAKAHLPGHLRMVCAVIISATFLLYFSFIPTAIACDFRYLFAAIPLITIVALILLLGSGREDFDSLKRTSQSSI